MNYTEAIKLAVEKQLESKNLYLLGQDIKTWGGQGGVFSGLGEKFPKQVIDTPIAESAVSGVATGMAMTGKHMLVEYGFLDFILHSSDQIINNAAKINYLSNGEFNVPVTYYATISSSRGYGATHSQSLEYIFTKVPGLDVVYPSNSTDAFDCLTQALEQKSPTLFLTHKLLLTSNNVFPSLEGKKARVIQEGGKLTVLTYGRSTHLVQKALEEMGGSDIEIIDLRWLNPVDYETLQKSALKTKNILFVEEGYGAIAADVLANLMELLEDSSVKMSKLHSRFSPIGVNAQSEKSIIIDTEEVKQKLGTLLRK